MQTFCVNTLNYIPFQLDNPSFCPKNAAAQTTNQCRHSAIEKIQNLRTSFSESSLKKEKPKRDFGYSTIAILEAEFFESEPPFFFTFDDSMFLFLWTIDRIRKGESGYFDDTVFNSNQIEIWNSLLKYAEMLCNQFIEMTPRLNSEDYLPNIRMVAILIAMKFYYEDASVYDADLIRALYFSKTGFKLHELDKIAKLCVNCIEVGITVHRIRKMETVFLAAIFKHSPKELRDDSGQHDVQTNPTKPFGSSSI